MERTKTFLIAVTGFLALSVVATGLTWAVYEITNGHPLGYFATILGAVGGPLLVISIVLDLRDRKNK